MKNQNTNQIGKGTVNVSVNLVEGEKNILGKLALKDDRSLSDFMRRLMVTGLRSTNPDAARQIEDARASHYEQMNLGL